jgi:hypothetical protein
MGTPWWINFLPETREINPRYLWFAGILILGCGVAGAFYHFRCMFLRVLDIRHYLHNLAHYLRDQQIKFYKLTAESHRDPLETLFPEYIEGICERTKAYFSSLIGDAAVQVAIRLAVHEPDPSGAVHVKYKTVARSSGFNESRAGTSENIAATEGIPRFLIDGKGSRGILIYNDLQQAERMGTFKFTHNDRTYPHEITTMMVAPLNGWGDEGQGMVGILYVTSGKENTFSAKYVDSMRFVADMIANSIAPVGERLKHLTSSHISGGTNESHS